MDDDRPWGLPLVACRTCRSRMPLVQAIVRMGATELFACPRCGHQEVWRKAVDAVTLSDRTGLASGRHRSGGSVLR